MLKKLMKGGGSLFIVSNIGVLFSVVIVYVNAKILTPEDFGVVGFATILITFLDSFKQIGTKEYLIANGVTDELQVMNAWSMDLIKSVSLFFVSVALTPVISNVYGVSSLNWIIPLLSLGFLLDGISNPKFYILRMELEYRNLIAYSFFVNVFYAVASISFVNYFGSYVGLIWGYFARSFAQFIFTYLFYPIVPRIYFKVEECIKQLNYGKWLLVCGVLFFFTSRFDVFVLSMMVDVKSLGFYTFAISIVTGIVALPLKSINNAFFPILSKNKNDLQLRLVVTFTSIVASVVALGACLVIPYVLELLFDNKWDNSIGALQLLSIGIAINSIRVDGYFLAIGFTKYKYKVELARALCFVSVIVPFVSVGGIEGAAGSFVLANMFGLGIWARYMNKINRDLDG